MADGLKLNLKEAIVLKNAEGTWWELKGKNSSGASFSWDAPIAFVVDVSISQSLSFTLTSYVSSSGKIYWGDGNTTDITSTSSYNHTYAASTGTYTVLVHCNSTYFSFETSSSNVTEVKSYGNARSGFQLPRFNCQNMTKVAGSIVPREIPLSSTFKNATSFNQDISGWDVSKVYRFDETFAGATSFNQDLSAWDTSGADSFSGMFQGASSFNQDIGNLDISGITGSTGLLNTLSGSGLSTENYSRTLIGWANQHYAGGVIDGISATSGSLTYNNTAYTTGNQFNDAVSARAYLVGTAGWTIIDGGQV